MARWRRAAKGNNSADSIKPDRNTHTNNVIDEWALPDISKTYPTGRKRVQIWGAKPKPYDTTLLRVTFEDSDVAQLKQLRVQPKINSKGLDKLQRYRIRVPSGFPLNTTSYGPPLYFHLKTIYKCGQINVGRSLLGLLHIIQKKINHFAIPEDRQDDYVRQHLKVISSQSFLKTFRDSPAYMYFVHLHALGGKAPYEKHEIESDISKWVDDNKKFNYPEFTTQAIDSIFNTWNVSYDDNAYLSFTEYCNDVLRWGTSGGTAKSEFKGEEYRTKWAWGFSRLTTDGGGKLKPEVDLYAEAKLQGEEAKVALKEEATKTRPVITTSMSSYLRQSYLAYRWGKPPINSPISSSSWLPIFQSTPYMWYGCLDGDRFDQTIPAWVIQYIIRKLGTISSECMVVANEENTALDNLAVRWGDRVWKWKGGLLSGWRLTSLIGSIVSCVVARFIISNAPILRVLCIGLSVDKFALTADPAIFKFIRRFELDNNSSADVTIVPYALADLPDLIITAVPLDVAVSMGVNKLNNFGPFTYASMDTTWTMVPIRQTALCNPWAIMYIMSFVDSCYWNGTVNYASDGHLLLPDFTSGKQQEHHRYTNMPDSEAAYSTSLVPHCSGFY